MNNMKTIRLLALITAFLPGLAGIVTARGVHIWPYQELLDKSDLVVLATPTATNDTKEHMDLPGFAGEHVIGVGTTFKVSAVLKGDKTPGDFVLHHYRTTNGSNIPHIPNGPGFVSFGPAANPQIAPQTFILFLRREADGRYAPVVGQTDPGEAIRELRGAGR
jgi:hypothetical protein